VLNEKIRSGLQKPIRSRAPWFSANIQEILWCKQLAFEHRLVKNFCRDRCWPASDAAHQTGPVGVQSLNVGFQEALKRAAALSQVRLFFGSGQLINVWPLSQRWEPQPHLVD